MRNSLLLCLIMALAPLVGTAEQEWLTAKLKNRDLSYEAVGTIQSKMVTTLSSKVVGNILEVLKREGDRVKKGEVVVKIEAKDIASDLAGANAGLSEASSMRFEIDKGLQAAVAQKEQVQAGLKLAKSSFDRINTLYERKSVSKQEYEQAESALNSAQAQLRAAEAQIEALTAKKSTISARMNQAQAGIRKVETIKELAEVTAPFSGRVTARRIEPGMLAAPGVQLMVIEDDSHLQFEAIVPESLIASITENQPVFVAVDALGGTKLDGTVAEIVPSGDSMSHTFIVKIAVSNQSNLKTGMYAIGSFVYGVEKVLSVPKSSIETRGQLEGIWGEGNGEPVFRLIKTGREMNDEIEILSGLNVGEKYLARPIERK